MTTLYFDESGYSGPNLLDKATPYYACSALRITEQRAQELKRLHFPDKLGELKFADMKAGRNFHRSLALMKTLLDEKAVKVTVIDKRFALSAKLFEWIAEPGLSGHFDLYSEGQLPQVASAFHFLANSEQPGKLRSVHETFQSVIKKPEANEVHALAEALEALEGSPGEIARKLLIEPLQGNYQELFEDYGITEGLLGILLTAAWHNLMLWGNVVPVGSPIHVVYDNHSVMAAEKATWDQLTSAKLNMRANGNAFRLDHKVTTELGDSKTHVALQIADVVAGFAVFAVQAGATKKHKPGEPLPPSLAALKLLADPAYQGDQHFVTVEAGEPSRFSGWEILKD